MKAICKEDVIAANTGNKLFIKGKEYEANTSGVKGSIRLYDEFGCLQGVADEKFFKRHFELLNEVNTKEEV